MEVHPIYEIVPTYIDDKKRTAINKRKGWEYGYNYEWDLIVISKDGTVGDVYYIEGLYIGLPEVPDKVDDRGNKWIPEPLPAELSKIKNSYDWQKRDTQFKKRWEPYINTEFDRREFGYWFINNKVPTYITGSHYMYIQWSKIDVGLPHFREANRILFIHWEACKADPRSLGQDYVKIRRSGFSYMFAAETVNVGTSAENARLGIVSKTGPDASKMFTGKVVPIFRKYPFFFKPIQDGNDNPKTELAFRVPATKITKKSLTKESEDEPEGLDTTIDWKNTDDNAYDGEKLLLLVEDEAGKWTKPNNIKEHWEIVQTCLKTGSTVVGKCAMGSTVNALAKGGANFKAIHDDSNPLERDGNGQTVSGLYRLFIPFYHNMEGHIDEFGWPVFFDPPEPIMGVDGKWVKQGAVSWWLNKKNSKRHDPDGLNEHYRQYPGTLEHAFRDESESSLFNLTKLYDQIDHNDGLMKQRVVIRGNFIWRDGIQDSEVLWVPDPNGRFYSSWIPPKHMQNRVTKKGDMKYPENAHLGAFGVDSYDISAVVGGGGSKGAIHGKTGFHMEDDAPTNFFFLEYIARPQTAEIFFEDVIMALHFYGMPVLAENNKPRLLYYMKDRGYRKFSLNRPDKKTSQLSKSEIELGGIPSTHEDVINAHANGIEAYIEKYVGFDAEGHYRDPSEIGNMYFERTLRDWAGFDITKRTKHDASISSGFAIMATNKHTVRAKAEEQKVTINMRKYNHNDMVSRPINNNN
jgi:hypothetical protein